MKILIADDESRMRTLLRDFLENSEYDVIEASDGESTLEAFYKNKDINLIILDIMMPKINGYDVLREIREKSDIPVIMLTAKNDEKDELLGFSLGVDEYITKPFSPKILVARIDAILRRSSKDLNSDIYECGEMKIYKKAHKVVVNEDEVALSLREFELLRFLVENPGIVLSREKILNAVWDYDYYGDARTVDTHVKKLRAKLGSQGRIIKTVWGIGYKLEE